MTADLVRVKTQGDFFVEEYQPCWYRSADALWFKNLEYSSIFVPTVSGILDLTPYTVGEPWTVDSPFWVVDGSGRALRFDQSSPAVSGSIILLGIQGTFQIWYKHQKRLNQLRAGNVFARFDEQIIPLTETPMDNPWSSHLLLNTDIVRGLRLNNTDIKTNLQAWSLSYNEEFRIAALLGLVDIRSWDSWSALSISGTAAIQVVPNRPFEYRVERPFVTAEGLRVSRILHEPVELWWSNRLIDRSTFTTSNTGIVLNTGYLDQTQQQNLLVKYKTITYQATGTAIVAETLPTRNHYVLENTGVSVDTGTLKVDWLWDGCPENTEGTVVFS